MQDDFMHNDQTNEQDQDDPQIRALLKDYPMPQADTGFFNHALARATHVGSRRQRNRWLMTGFGSAVAAGVAVWLIGGLFRGDLPDEQGARCQCNDDGQCHRE